MYALISPAKRLNEPALSLTLPITRCELSSESSALFALLKTLNVADFRALMTLSEPLAQLNVRRAQQLGLGTPVAAVALFDGDTYRGFDARTLSTEALARSQERVGILSGLYGLLRPLDGIEPHRLEMATKLQNERGANLYAFWGDRIGLALKRRLQPGELVVNLASQAYFKAARSKALGIPVLDVVFQETRNGQPKVIGLMAKRARGAMARTIVTEDLKRAEQLKDFDLGGYQYLPDESTEHRWIFRRD